MEEQRFYCCSTFLLRAKMLCFLLQSASVSSLLQHNHLSCTQYTNMGPSWPWSYGSCFYKIRARCTTLCDIVCQWLATGRWFSLGPPVSSTNKTDRHDITEILLKVALNTINQTNNYLCNQFPITTDVASSNLDQGLI